MLKPIHCAEFNTWMTPTSGWASKDKGIVTGLCIRLFIKIHFAKDGDPRKHMVRIMVLEPLII